MVARSPWPFIICPLLLFAILGPFHLLLLLGPAPRIPDENVIVGSPSWTERETFSEFSTAAGGRRLWQSMFALAADGGDLLRPETLAQLVALNEFFLDELRVDFAGRAWVFRDFCEPACEDNSPTTTFLRLLEHNSTLIHYTYPTFSYAFGGFHDTVYIGYGLQGVETDGDGRVRSARSFALNLHFILPTPELEAAGRAWILGARAAAVAHNDAGNSSVLLLPHDHDTLAEEVGRSVRRGSPFLPVAIGGVLLFCLANTVRRSRAESKPVEGLFAVLTPLAAIAAAFGLLLLLGWQMGTVVYNSPFIILAIGVDDAFLLVHAFRRISVSFPPEQRIARTLSHVGPSITITSLTNAVSFGVGAIASSDLIRSFAVFTSVTVCLGYIFQLTLFVGILTLSARREKAGVNLLSCGAAPRPPPAHAPLRARPSRATTCCDRTLHNYIRFLVSTKGLVVSLVALSAYLATAAYGCTLVTVALTDELIYLPNSLFRKTFVAIESHSMAASPSVVIVNSPGDLRNKSRLEGLERLVSSLESMPGMLGPASTNFFLPDFLAFVRLEATEIGRAEGVDFFCPYSLRTFLTLGTARRWAQFLHLNESACGSSRDYRADPECVRASASCVAALSFITGYTAPGAEKAARVTAWRAWAAAPNASDFNVTIYTEMNIYGDQLLALPGIGRSTIGSAVGFMTLICLLFIPSLPSVAAAVVAMMSINLGVIGGLALCGYAIDMITMCCILMAIGFSVDYVAHMSYHYFRAAGGQRRTVSEVVLRSDPSMLKVSVSRSSGNGVVPMSNGVHSANGDGPKKANGAAPNGVAHGAPLPSFGADWRGKGRPSRRALFWSGTSEADLATTGARFQRIEDALSSIIVPTLQAAGSTLIVMLTLPILVGGYIYESFLVTLLLVVLSGLIHALFFLPVFLSRLTCS